MPLSVTMPSGRREAVYHNRIIIISIIVQRILYKLYVYLFYFQGPIIYSIYVIAVPNPLPSDSESTQNDTRQLLPNSTPNPILQLKSIAFNYVPNSNSLVLNDPDVDEDVKEKKKIQICNMGNICFV